MSRHLALLALGFVTSVMAQGWSPEFEFTVDELHQDLRVLKKIYEDVHPGLYRYRSPDEVEALFEQADTAIQSSMTEREFLGVLSPVITGLRCMHSVLLGSHELNNFEEHDALVFPLRVKIIDGRLWMRDSCLVQTVPAGAEILAINETDAEVLLGLLVAHGSADGDNGSRKRHLLENHFASRYWRYIGEPEVFDVRYLSPDGDESTARLEAKPARTVLDCVTAREHDSTRAFTLEILDDSKIAVMTLPTFLPGNSNIKRFIKRSFGDISGREIDALVLDLRGNPGGFDDLAVLLMRYIAIEPFRYFRSLDTTVEDLSFLDNVEGSGRGGPFRRLFASPRVMRFLDRRHPGLKIQKPMRTAYRGPVYALVDGGSASTTAEFCAVSQYLGRVKLVGEECGGGYLGDNGGQINIVTLPNSRVRVSLPMTRYMLEVEDTGNNGGATPDYPVEPNIADLINGRDTEREFLIRLIQGL